MDQLLTEFNEFLKDKASFANYRGYTGSRYGYYAKAKKTKMSPGEIIVELNKLNYTFTQKNFTEYLRNCTYRKKTGYLRSYCDDKSRDDGMKIMFTKFKPTKRQVDVILGCLGDLYDDNIPTTIDLLQETGYEFTKEHYESIVGTHYDILKLYANIDYDKIIEQDIKNMVSSILLRNDSYSDEADDDISKLKDFVDNIQIQYSDTFTEWLLEKCSKKSHIQSYQNMLSLFLKQNIINIKDNTINNLLMKEFVGKGVIDIFLDQKFIPNKELMEHLIYTKNIIGYIPLFHKKYAFVVNENVLNHCLKEGDLRIDKKDLRQLKYTKQFIDSLKEAPKVNTYDDDEEDIEEDIEEESIDESEESEKSEKEPVKTTTKGKGKAVKKPVAVKDEKVRLSEFIINIGIKPDDIILTSACQYGHIEMIKQCLHEYKLQPSSKHLELILQSKVKTADLIPLFNEFMSYKIKLTKAHFNSIHKNSNNNKVRDIIQLLIKWGYPLDYEDIGKLMDEGINMDKIENYGLKYDENLYYYSYLYDNWSYEKNFDQCIEKKILELRRLCKNPKSTVKELEEYMKNENIQPDRYCFDHACINNHDILEYLIEQYKPTLTSLYWAGGGNNQKIFLEIIKDYKIDSKYMMEPLTKR